MIHEGLLRCVDYYERGVAKPVIDSTYPIDRAAEAFGQLEHGRNVGKVLLIP